MPNCLWILVLLDFQHFWPCFAQTITSSAPDRKEKLVLFGPLLQDVLSAFFQDGRPENDIIKKYQKRQKQGIWLPLGKRKFFLINRFSLHEILIKMDCLTQGCVQWWWWWWGDLHTQASFSSPIISSPEFHLVVSVNQRIPLMKVS